MVVTLQEIARMTGGTGIDTKGCKYFSENPKPISSLGTECNF
jgi:hypothetical protein